MATDKEIEAAARAVFVQWRNHCLLERGVKQEQLTTTFDKLDAKERKFALNNAKAALTAAEQVRASEWNEAIEAAATMLDHSAFYYKGTCAETLVVSATGEAATHVCAKHIRQLKRSPTTND